MIWFALLLELHFIFDAAANGLWAELAKFSDAERQAGLLYIWEPQHLGNFKLQPWFLDDEKQALELFVPQFPFHGIIIIRKRSWGQKKKNQGDEIKHWLIHVDHFFFFLRFFFLIFKRPLKEGIFLLETEDWEGFLPFQLCQRLHGWLVCLWRGQTETQVLCGSWIWLVLEGKENLYLSLVLLWDRLLRFHVGGILDAAKAGQREQGWPTSTGAGTAGAQYME